MIKKVQRGEDKREGGRVKPKERESVYCTKGIKMLRFHCIVFIITHIDLI